MKQVGLLQKNMTNSQLVIAEYALVYNFFLSLWCKICNSLKEHYD